MSSQNIRFNLNLGLELNSRLEAWIKEQLVPPTKTEVIKVALKQFLDDREHGKKK